VRCSRFEIPVVGCTGRLEGEEITVPVVVWPQERSLCRMLASRIFKFIVRVFLVVRLYSHKPSSSEFAAQIRDTYVIDQMTHMTVSQTYCTYMCAESESRLRG
jgi:hypothetical protein